MTAVLPNIAATKWCAMDLYSLSEQEQKTYSFVRSRVLFQLLAEVGKYDEQVKPAFSSGMALSISAVDGPTLQLSGNKEEIKVTESGVTPQISLWFPSTDQLNRLLTQRKSFMIPFPLSFKAGKAIGTFKKSIERLQWYMDPEAERPDHQRFITRLLLTATAYGVKEVAAHDEKVKPKVDRIKDGVIEIYVRGAEDLAIWLEKKGRNFTVHQGRAPMPPNARLIFADPESAHGLLSGSLEALVAVVDHNIFIRGNFPMVQNLFPLLNRLGVFMSVK